MFVCNVHLFDLTKMWNCYLTVNSTRRATKVTKLTISSAFNTNCIFAFKGFDYIIDMIFDYVVYENYCTIYKINYCKEVWLYSSVVLSANIYYNETNCTLSLDWNSFYWWFIYFNINYITRFNRWGLHPQILHPTRGYYSFL